MPTTSPDNIYYPSAATNLGVETITATMAGSVQTALNSRQIKTYRWTNAAARTAQTGMASGDTGYQIDTGIYYRYNGTIWVAEIETYATPITVAAGYTITGQEARRFGSVLTIGYQATKNAGNWAISDQIGTINPAGIRPVGRNVYGSAINNNTGGLIGTTAQTGGPIFFTGATGAVGTNLLIGSLTYVISM